MKCPKCRKDYDDSVIICPECGEKLIPASPETERIEYEAMKPVKLVNVTNHIDAGIIMNLLLNNDIPCFKKDKFLGGYMNLYMGYSVYGEDIYVDERDYEKALDIISILTPEEDADELDAEGTISEASDQTDSDYSSADADTTVPVAYPVFYKNPRIVARIILGFMLAGALFVMLSSYID
jgi:hypothetical protein